MYMYIIKSNQIQSNLKVEKRLFEKARMEVYGAAMEEITRYTGLSPAAFFTIAAMMVVVYSIVSGMFVGPEDFNKPPVAATIDIAAGDGSSLENKYFSPTTKPTQMGDMTEQQLRSYGGSDPDKPLLMAIRGVIYDVSSSRNFYGPGGPYAMFAGREASRALALLSFKPQDINGNLEGLGPEELGILQDWEDKFVDKYEKVGQLVAEQTKIEQTEKDEQVVAEQTKIEQTEKDEKVVLEPNEIERKGEHEAEAGIEQIQ